MEFPKAALNKLGIEKQTRNIVGDECEMINTEKQNPIETSQSRFQYERKNGSSGGMRRLLIQVYEYPLKPNKYQAIYKNGDTTYVALGDCPEHAVDRVEGIWFEKNRNEYANCS